MAADPHPLLYLVRSYERDVRHGVYAGAMCSLAAVCAFLFEESAISFLCAGIAVIALAMAQEAMRSAVELRKHIKKDEADRG